jgi:hypothetical protein
VADPAGNRSIACTVPKAVCMSSGTSHSELRNDRFEGRLGRAELEIFHLLLKWRRDRPDGIPPKEGLNCELGGSAFCNFVG